MTPLYLFITQLLTFFLLIYVDDIVIMRSNQIHAKTQTTTSSLPSKWRILITS